MVGFSKRFALPIRKWVALCGPESGGSLQVTITEDTDTDRIVYIVPLTASLPDYDEGLNTNTLARLPPRGTPIFLAGGWAVLTETDSVTLELGMA